MQTYQTPDKNWNELVTELQDFQNEQQESWGGADEMLIARYLAGDCDQHEREVVEEAARSSLEVQECIELARKALGGDSPELVVPAKNPLRQSKFRRVPRRSLSAAVLNWAVAVSLLVLIVGGAYELVRIKSESADILAKVDKLQNIQDRITQLAGVGTLDEVPKKLLEQDATIQDKEKIIQDQQKEHDVLLTTNKELEKQNATLRNKPEQVATNEAVPKIESVLRPSYEMMKPSYHDSDASPETVSKMQQDIKILRSKFENLEKVVTAQKESNGSCQSSTQNQNRYVACYVPDAQLPPCITQPSSCVSLPTPCFDSCVNPCQVSASPGYSVSSSSIASYSNNNGWISSNETNVVPLYRTPSTVTHPTTAPISTSVAQSGNGYYYVLRPITPNTGMAVTTPHRYEVVMSASNTGVNYNPATQRSHAEPITVAKPATQTSGSVGPKISSTSALESKGWREARD